jgi:hypothetical protein
MVQPRVDGGDGVHVGAMAAVLGNDNLLHHILVHLNYPTSIICAALVCKLWLRHVTSPEFIRRFSGQHFLGYHSRLLLGHLRQRCVVQEEEDDASQLVSVDDRWSMLQEAEKRTDFVVYF